MGKFTEIFSSLSDNQLFNAGFGLIGVGASLSILKKSFGFFDLAIKKYCTNTIEIPSKDKSYQWILSWLSRQKMLANNHTMVETEFNQLETGKIVSKYSFPPATGNHYMLYNKIPIKVVFLKYYNYLDTKNKRKIND